MPNPNHTQPDLRGELESLRRQVAELREAEAARQVVEESLRESEEKFRSLAEKSPNMIFINVKGRVVYANEKCEEIMGYRREELYAPDFDFHVLIAPEDRQLVEENLKRHMRGEEIPSYEYTVVTRAGERLRAIHTTRLIRYEGETAVLGIITDITERTRAEAAHRRLATVVHQAAEAILITDTAGTIEYVNPAFTRMTGYSSEEAIGRNPRLLKSGKHDEQFYRSMWASIQQGKDWTARFVNRRKDGSLYYAESTISAVHDNNGAIVNYVAVQRDITQEVLLEEQLRQAQRMEAVGRLAGGMAHDFNNLLTGITGYTELALLELGGNDPIREHLQEIRKAAERASELTRQLLTFSRRQVLTPRVLDLNAIVTEMEKLIRRLIGEDLDVAVVLEPELWYVHADPSQLEQVILNLVVNARDAMPRGGKLTLETANVELGADYAKRHVDVEPGPYVMLAISDTGHGMDSETRERIFEPFFTTKDKEKGTGLGLSMVYGIVQQSGGHIWVYSEPGEGTTFKIYLPRAADDTRPAEESVIQHSSLQGTETVLLVEDDDLVRGLARRVLTKNGYQVLEARNAGEALLLCERHQGAIDLMVSDVIMPQMNGPELVQRLTRVKPEMRVLYMSGYTDNAILHRHVLSPATAFLQKPFTPEDLARKVREVLEAG